MNLFSITGLKIQQHVHSRKSLNLMYNSKSKQKKMYKNC
jgi:hypothetical protein